MLFRLLKSFFPPMIMWIDEGGSDLGTAGEDVSTEVKGDITSTPEAPVVDTPPVVSVEEVQKLRKENERLKEYAEFVKQVSQASLPKVEKPDIAPDTITYAEDVDKIVDYKLHEFLAQKEAQQVEQDLRNLADENRANDPMFDARMELAIEYMDKDEISQARFSNARTAKEKIAVLEKMAKWHPKYDLLQKPVETPPVDDAIKRLQANAEIPATLATMQTAGKTQKSVSDMNETEFDEFFRTITKGY